MEFIFIVCFGRLIRTIQKRFATPDNTPAYVGRKDGNFYWLKSLEFRRAEILFSMEKTFKIIVV